MPATKHRLSSGTNATSSIVLTAGAISMAKSEADHYARELKREQEEIIAVAETEAAEVAEILAGYGVEAHDLIS
ncbi:hypothetical protein JHK82_013864 [Glycine max]|nr:hypothetical protein JHK85_014242 [Glycine max]KAG5155895.1 hypothetical protein JHK82_013864 [Glycine max]